MSNARVPAADPGLPASRRSFLSTATVAVTASLPGCSLLSPAAASILKAAPYVPLQEPRPDPLISLIREYQAGTAEFNERASIEHWEGLDDATYGPSMDRLCADPPSPTTLEGALAGLDFVLSEMTHFMNSDANEAVLRVCVAFLRGRLSVEGVVA